MSPEAQPIAAGAPPRLETAFDRALARVFKLEGGQSDQPADHGGSTKFGISLRYLRTLGADRGGDIDLDGDVDAADILALRPEHARALYERDFWKASGADQVADHSEDLAAKLFEFSVVVGPVPALMALQRALGDCRSPVAVDGRFGPATYTAVLRIDRVALTGELLQAFRRREAEHFLGILERDRSQLVFAVGWLRRALDLAA